MYLIVGLGNPEPEYSNTRHNMGFDTINIISRKFNIELSQKKFEAISGNGIISGEKVILIKPQTYMNDSGKSVKQYVDFYEIPLSNLLVIYDDMDTEIQKIRVRSGGGPGSHNGMKSLVDCLNSENFMRIRVGIGRPITEFDRINYVIGKVPQEEYNRLKQGVEKAAEAVEYYIKNGIDNTMNIFNK